MPDAAGLPDKPLLPLQEFLPVLTDGNKTLVLATLQLIDSKGQPDSLNADRFRILARVAAMDGASSSEIDSHVEKDMGRSPIELL